MKNKADRKLFEAAYTSQKVIFCVLTANMAVM